MDSKIGFEMNRIVVEAIRGRCASFTVLTATVSEIFGGQTTPSILVVGPIDVFQYYATGRNAMNVCEHSVCNVGHRCYM